MECRHLNVRTVVFVLLGFVLMNANRSQNIMATDNRNGMDFTKKQLTNGKANQHHNSQQQQQQDQQDNNDNDYLEMRSTPSTLSCPLNRRCHELTPPCLRCNYSYDCRYGDTIEIGCEVETFVNCDGNKKMKKSFICRYCYQTERWEHRCELKANCNSVSTPLSHYQTNCTVNDDVLCLGRRTFNKNVRCNWTGGYRWSTALVLSVTLGGFGADRFYLGHWQEGIGKLFSFGGLGVWTLIDVLLISLHYLGPADGSLYI